MLQLADFGSSRSATQGGYHFAEQGAPEPKLGGLRLATSKRWIQVLSDPTRLVTRPMGSVSNDRDYEKPKCPFGDRHCFRKQFEFPERSLLPSYAMAKNGKGKMFTN